ncbi:hypothetical protein TcCL_NonESM10135, partial [Trypanosoma cruzi]
MPSGNGCRANQRRAREQAKQQKQGNAHTAEDRKKHEQSKNCCAVHTVPTGISADGATPRVGAALGIPPPQGEQNLPGTLSCLSGRMPVKEHATQASVAPVA